MSITSQAPFGPDPFLGGELSHSRILVAEDPFINTFLRTILQRHGHKVVTGEASQASDFLLNGSVKADLVITNNPSEFLAFTDSLPILYTAANPDPDIAALFRICRVLRKPFRNEELLEAVEQLSRLVM